ncbi:MULTISPECIES: ABC transporter ATP-binding protein [Bacillus]|uniref:ABC transporter ATP-binding protein n=1 Tax=Bacillus cereus TaxID=1396 RepID=A0A2A8INZ0_BACCE|nr:MULTISPECIES: ABC transporter ATP-binding protein [Bacillus]MDH4422871.1 ABC transporter ATP-binding protein [Bacillus cereus]PER20618.1 ABC transporter ATP-binding protein [Bacillus cereus]PFA60810.1 ABC transporter ATP-binding protein [Bacillus sp. AFS015896]PGL80440.1 ABC transporter ATP-binding protein [Bacillus sp. AFS054943]PGT97409.1 ABC transporter ATP-binding protein [Bacillus cereus]
MSFLFVLSIAIILLFVLFTLYYYIAGKKEVPHRQLLEEEFDREE